MAQQKQYYFTLTVHVAHKDSSCQLRQTTELIPKHVVPS